MTAHFKNSCARRAHLQKSIAFVASGAESQIDSLLACRTPIRLFYYSGRLGYRLLTVKAVHPHRRTAAGPSGDHCNIPPIPIGLAIRMMARVAGRSAQRA